MSSTATPADPLAQLSFELERFQWEGEERLEVSGRWFAVRGRRFVRPTLTLRAGGRRRRMIAVLDHKPWAAVDEAPWKAAFAWRGPQEEIASARLEVAPDVVLELPAPGETTQATLLHPRPRRGSTAPATAAPPAVPDEIPAPDDAAAEPEPDPPAAPAPDAEAIREEAERDAQDRLERELGAAREHLESELAAAQAQLEEAQQRIAALTEHEAVAIDRANEVVRLEGELAAAQAAPERSKRELVEARRRAERAEQMTAGLRQRVTDANNLTARLERRLVEAGELNERLQKRIAELEAAPAPPSDATVEFTPPEVAAAIAEPPPEESAPPPPEAVPPAPVEPTPLPAPPAPLDRPRRMPRRRLNAQAADQPSWVARAIAITVVGVLLIALAVLILTVL
jgi:hypothetical protein